GLWSRKSYDGRRLALAGVVLTSPEKLMAESTGTQGLRALANTNDPESFSNRMRRRRMRLFEKLVETVPKPVRLLDIGGTVNFWKQAGWTDRDDVKITLVNLMAQETGYPHIESRIGDAANLTEIEDQSFDVVFSNSVIEHLFSFEKQAAMAKEVERVGRRYWIQTPNFWFPMEPHFHFPGWQWLPESVRVALLLKRRCGWRGPCPDREEARRFVQEVRLLSRRELKKIFPRAQVLPERFYGLVKSWVVVGGFNEPG